VKNASHTVSEIEVRKDNSKFGGREAQGYNREVQAEYEDQYGLERAQRRSLVRTATSI
jgi:hypothetical protein